MERYMHYYRRYNAHHQAMKHADTLFQSHLVFDSEQQDVSIEDSAFIIEAIEQLISCRRMLKYTYVLGYYLSDNTPEKELFEHHQEMLEKNTDRLHEYTEKPVLELNGVDVLTLAKVTDKFMQSLKQIMSGGMIRLDEISSSSTN